MSGVVQVPAELARDAVVALTELRGWTAAGTRREREFVLPRIDAALAAFGVDDIVRGIHRDVLEDIPPREQQEPQA